MANIVFQQAKWLYREFGLNSLQETGFDAWLIILSRCFRMLAYGTNALVLALFFNALEFSDYQIGLFMTLTLLGDLVLGGFTTLIADRLGRRKVLLGGSLLMVATGAIFSYFENFWILLFAAVIGVVSATGNDYGPFRPIEESTLSQLTSPETRADVLAWYVTIASVGSAVGTEVSGRIVDALQSLDGWETKDAYHSIFWIYTAMGLCNTVFALLMSEKCEAERIADVRPKSEESKSEEEGILLDEMDSDEEADTKKLEGGGDRRPAIQAPPSQLKKRGYFAEISRGTLAVMYKLWTLLLSDSLADGMVGYSLTVYYMDRKFSPNKSTLGDVTSFSYFLASISTVFAGPLARRLGLINTMVFTHLPSSASVLLFPFPSNIWLAIALFFVRTGLNNMDQAPRSAFIAAVVKPEERTAVMGITGMVRTLASAAGPSVTGLLAGNDNFWIAFVVAGALRMGYDLGLWAMFVNMKLHQHEDGGQQQKDEPQERRPEKGKAVDESDSDSD